MEKDDARNAILDSANRVLMRNGMAGATIDAIAEEAGLSKGGLLYYFSNKEELLSETMLRHETLINARLDEILSSLPERPRNRLRAMVLATLDYMENVLKSEHYAIGALGVPAYTNVIGDMKGRMFREIAKEAASPDKVAIVLLILDGIWINNVFRSGPVTPDLKEQTVRLILDMADSCCERAAPSE